MKAEIKRTLTVTENEERIISTFLTTLEDVFELDFTETPADLAEIMCTIAVGNSRAHLLYDKGTIAIEYQKN